MKIRKLLLAACSTLVISPAFADTITLDLIVRDFAFSHPDFESYLGGLTPGMVDSTLGGDSTPVYVPGAPQITSASSFYDWYHDTSASVKLSKSITLDNGLGATTGGVYTYDNPSFFPIDGEGLGNNYGSHNYGFTVEMHTAFTYEAGQTFSFRGDDDLWVFINKSLVIDLGGVHGPASASVSLDSLGLTVGETYDLDLFFAERHTTGSSFKIETTIESLTTVEVPEPGILTLLGLGLLSLGLRRRLA